MEDTSKGGIAVTPIPPNSDVIKTTKRFEALHDREGDFDIKDLKEGQTLILQFYTLEDNGDLQEVDPMQITFEKDPKDHYQLGPLDLYALGGPLQWKEKTRITIKGSKLQKDGSAIYSGKIIPGLFVETDYFDPNLAELQESDQAPIYKPTGNVLLKDIYGERSILEPWEQQEIKEWLGIQRLILPKLADYKISERSKT